jgi:hypothetical protein
VPETLTSPNLAQQNIELLKQAEYGEIMAEVYQTAIELDPGLVDVKFVPLTEDHGSPAEAMPAWASESGRHEVGINLDDMDSTLGKITKVIEMVPGAHDLFAGQVGVEPRNLTPEVLLAHVVGHELGHIREFMDYEDNPEALAARRKAEKGALPVKNKAVTELMRAGSAANNRLREDWPAISSGFGVTTLAELYGIQHTAYRNMTSERVADSFAVEIFALRRDLVDQLAWADNEKSYLR